MKKLIKKIGNIPTLNWAVAVIICNVIVVIANSVPLIITVNGFLLGIGLIGIFSRFMK
jgi:hypothetical protein